MRHSCATLLYVTIVGHPCRTLLLDTLMGHSCGTLCDTEHSCSTLLWDTRVGNSRLRQNSCASSLQNEHFVRDFLQISRVKSPKRALRTRLPKKSRVKVSKMRLQKSSGKLRRRKHIQLPCQAVSRFQPLQATPAHTPIAVTATFTSTTSRNRTIPCAGQENCTSTPHNTRKALPRPRNVTMSFASTKFAPSHKFGMISTLTSTKVAI